MRDGPGASGRGRRSRLARRWVAGAVLAAAVLAGCTTASDAASACGGASLRITVGQFGVGHGHFGGALLFRNVGASDCTLQGYPVARAVSSTGGHTVPVQQTARGYVGGLLPGRRAMPRVTLAPGAVASAILEGTAGAADPARCASYRALEVGVPGKQATTTLAIETTSCRRLQVHPIVPGESGDQAS
jgi:Protein of unknown function (DUF4232)